MKSQNQVILSIGSNQGERLENIEESIQLLNKEVGTVIFVSRIYETPSWGFKSNPFYNCALILHTYKSADLILTEILSIEKKQGRVRTFQIGYQARNIDIDIIAFNEAVIDTEVLRVPHPQMQNRRFVLLPMADLETNFVHPSLKKNIQELLRDCLDLSDCRVVRDSISFKSFYSRNCNYIAIEGNIGAGKTSLVNKIAEDFNAKTILERFRENPFLPKFYKNQARFAFPLEMSFLADRYQQLSDDLLQYNLFKDFIVADYHIFKSLIFAKITLAEHEYRIYKELFAIICKEIKKPDLYVYLYRDTNSLLQNIKKRGRKYEQLIQTDYLNKINSGYLDYIKSKTDLNVLIIDVSDKDFIKNQQDYLFVLKTIQSKLDTMVL